MTCAFTKGNCQIMVGWVFFFFGFGKSQKGIPKAQVFTPKKVILYPNIFHTNLHLRTCNFHISSGALWSGGVGTVLVTTSKEPHVINFIV
jgi:hypothetical protein